MRVNPILSKYMQMEKAYRGFSDLNSENIGIFCRSSNYILMLFHSRVLVNCCEKFVQMIVS